MTWTKGRLEAFTRNVLGDQKLIVVSNREPYEHVHHNGDVICSEPAGGLTSALKPIIAAARGSWVARASGNADRQAADAQGRVAVPPDDPSFTLRRLWIPEHLNEGYYNGLANQALWPLCHNVYRRPSFRSSDWQDYSAVNALFADAVLDEVADQPAIVFLQDYHLALLPRLLKKRNPSITVAQFWHIPWPNREIMQTFPWLDELLDGMLGNDLLGFHLPQHCANFFDTVDSALPARIDRVRNSVRRGDHSTVVQDAPISIDFDRHSRDAESREVNDHLRKWKQRVGDVARVGLGIDRIDYTKGIPERLSAFDLVLERFPELRGKMTLVQVAVPSRGAVAEFACLEQEVDLQAAAINERWGTPTWTPVIVEKRNLNEPEMMALHRLANFCLVTSLHDGMNLVAKEFVASRFDGDGVLILSRFAGAARELTTALQVNPFSEDAIVDAIVEAVNMPRAARVWRMAQLRACVQSNNVYRWAGTLIESIAELSRGSTQVGQRPPVKFAASVA